MRRSIRNRYGTIAVSFAFVGKRSFKLFLHCVRSRRKLRAVAVRDSTIVLFGSIPSLCRLLCGLELVGLLLVQ